MVAVAMLGLIVLLIGIVAGAMVRMDGRSTLPNDGVYDELEAYEEFLADLRDDAAQHVSLGEPYAQSVLDEIRVFQRKLREE